MNMYPIYTLGNCTHRVKLSVQLFGIIPRLYMHDYRVGVMFYFLANYTYNSTTYYAVSVYVLWSVCT